ELDRRALGSLREPIAHHQAEIGARARERLEDVRQDAGLVLDLGAPERDSLHADRHGSPPRRSPSAAGRRRGSWGGSRAPNPGERARSPEFSGRERAYGTTIDFVDGTQNDPSRFRRSFCEPNWFVTNTVAVGLSTGRTA